MNFIKFSYVKEIVAVFLLGCTKTFLSFNSLSKSTVTLFSVSFVIASGVTDPGITPNTLSRVSGDAK